LARIEARIQRFTGTTQRGAIWAAAAAVLSGIVWYVVVEFTASQSLYFGLGMGAAIGYAASMGAHGRGPRLGLIAGAIAAVAVVICLYYVNRFTFIHNEARQRRALSIPVLPGPRWFWFVLTEGVKSVVYQYLYLFGCPALALFFAWRGTEASLNPLSQSAPAATGGSGRAG
jgi:hypothetical protein